MAARPPRTSRRRSATASAAERFDRPARPRQLREEGRPLLRALARAHARETPRPAVTWPEAPSRLGTPDGYLDTVVVGAPPHRSRPGRRRGAGPGRGHPDGSPGTPPAGARAGRLGRTDSGLVNTLTAAAPPLWWAVSLRTEGPPGMLCEPSRRPFDDWPKPSRPTNAHELAPSGPTPYCCACRRRRAVPTGLQRRRPCSSRGT